MRRVKSFMRRLVKTPEVVGGKLTDWVIRYETQGRGSVHAHMLWWIDLDQNYMSPLDEVNLSEEIEQQYHLLVKEIRPEGEVEKRLYDKLLLNYTNGNIWALEKIHNLMKRLRVVGTNE